MRYVGGVKEKMVYALGHNMFVIYLPNRQKWRVWDSDAERDSHGDICLSEQVEHDTFEAAHDEGRRYLKALGLDVPSWAPSNCPT